MSKITENLLVKGARGKLGGQVVYKQKGDETILSKMPKFDKTKPPSAKQEKNRELFSEAQQYAMRAIADPDLKAEYQAGCAKSKAAYNAAMRDYRMPPVIEWVYTDDYDGQAGKPILVHATDDFRVVEVRVSLLSAAGDLLEEGPATLSPIFKNRWIYTTQQANADFTGTVVKVTAKDLPGNESQLSQAV